METSVLKTYLSEIIDCYKSIYTSQELRKHIKSQIDELLNKNKASAERPSEPVFTDYINENPDNSMNFGVIIGLIFGGFIAVGVLMMFIGGEGSPEEVIPLYLLAFVPAVIYIIVKIHGISSD
jgi:hypothetical protein